MVILLNSNTNTVNTHIHRKGQGELTCTLVLAVKTQLLEIVYFWKFDTKFSF
jgi:hypothetical protein